MLKKKNVIKLLFATMFTMLFCCANFLGFSASNLRFANSLRLDGADVSTWSYKDGKLNLNNITYEETIVLDNTQTQIIFTGTNKLFVAGDVTIDLAFHTLSFSGVGNSSLTIGDGDSLIFANVSSPIDIGNLSCRAWLGEEAAAPEFTGSIPVNSAALLTKLELTSVADEHQHNFKFEAEGSVIGASCENDGCSLDVSTMTATLSVENVVAGQTPTPSFVFGANWTELGENLELNDDTLKYYLATAENSTETSGEPLSQVPSEAGNYVAVATFNLAGSEVSAKKAFKITAVSASITPVDSSKTVEYGDLDNGSVDPSTMFNFVNCDGLTRKYYLVTDSGDVEIPADNYYLSIGTYTFKAVVFSGVDTPVAEASTVLVVEKTTPVFSVTFAKWEYGAKTPSHRVEGNVNADLLTYTYYYDPEYTDPVGAIPTEIGTYYVVIEFVGSDTMKEGSTTSTCTIIKKSITITWPNVTVVYNGEVQTINATFKGVNEQETPLVVTFDAEFKNANTYTATASLTEEQQKYYILPEVVTRQYTIIPLELVVKVNNVSSYYQSPVKTLTAEYQGGTAPVNGEIPYILHCEVTSESEMGAYEIIGRPTSPENTNYSIRFINGVYYVKNRILTLSIDNWVYGEPKEPIATAYYGEDKVIYSYYNLSTGETTNIKPTEPGRYRLEARIVDDEEYYCASYDGVVNFTISKVKVSAPSIDKTKHVYDGSLKTYRIEAQPTYKVEGNLQSQAGTYKVKITLTDPAHYTWQDTSLSSLEYIFVIDKKQIDRPATDNRVFKYNGNNQEYFVSASSNYIVDGNVQSEVGEYAVRIALTDSHNTCWDNGLSSALEYSFVINQAEITNPNTTNSKGESITSNPVLVVDAGENGIHPKAELNVVEINSSDKAQIKTATNALKNKLNTYDSIFRIYDVSLKNGDVVYQPNGTITLKIAVPKELLSVDFKVYHIHTDENGNKTVEESECMGANELGYVTIQVDKLSEFVFVYEKNSLMPLIITFICLLLVFAGVLAVELYLYFKLTGKIKPKTNKKMLALMPTMFVGSEIAWSIILGVLLAGVVAGDIILFLWLLKDRKKKLEQRKQKEADTPTQAVDMSKTKKETANKTSKVSKPKEKNTKTTSSKIQKKVESKEVSKEPRSLDFTKKK